MGWINEHMLYFLALNAGGRGGLGFGFGFGFGFGAGTGPLRAEGLRSEGFGVLVLPLGMACCFSLVVSKELVRMGGCGLWGHGNFCVTADVLTGVSSVT